MTTRRPIKSILISLIFIGIGVVLFLVLQTIDYVIIPKALESGKELNLFFRIIHAFAEFVIKYVH